MAAFQNLDLFNETDPLEGASLGGMTSAVHISFENAERSHAGRAYYEPVSSRTNLEFLPGAVVERILFRKQDHSAADASGVRFSHQGKSYEVTASKEVILAAGAFASPQILELSGIGDAKLLKSHKIEIIYDNSAVGGMNQMTLREGQRELTLRKKIFKTISVAAGPSKSLLTFQHAMHATPRRQ